MFETNLEATGVITASESKETKASPEEIIDSHIVDIANEFCEVNGVDSPPEITLVFPSEQDKYKEIYNLAWSSNSEPPPYDIDGQSRNNNFVGWLPNQDGYSYFIYLGTDLGRDLKLDKGISRKNSYRLGEEVSHLLFTAHMHSLHGEAPSHTMVELVSVVDSYFQYAAKRDDKVDFNLVFKTAIVEEDSIWGDKPYRETIDSEDPELYYLQKQIFPKSGEVAMPYLVGRSVGTGLLMHLIEISDQEGVEAATEVWKEFYDMEESAKWEYLHENIDEDSLPLTSSIDRKHLQEAFGDIDK